MNRPTRVRRAGVLGALAVLLVTLAVGATPPGAVAAGGVKVAVTSLFPGVAAPGTTLTVAGTVTNRGDQVVRDVAIRLRLSATHLNSRAELAAVIAGQAASRDGEVLLEAPLVDLAPGGSTPFTLHQALSDVPWLTEFGVYVLGIEVVGTRGSSTGRVSITRTLLPWVPDPPDISPTGFSWVWPLVEAPMRQADGRFVDDSLAADLAIGGRLDRLVQAGARLADGAGVTWAIDPDLIETVADMADENGYLVARGDASVPGGGGALAQQWLDRLRTATAGADVLALPYADPDVAALVRNGQPRHVAQARRIGADSLSALLPSASVIDDIAWPLDGYLDRDTVDSLGRAGVSAAVLDGRALPTTVDDLAYTPSGRAQLRSSSGRMAALLADPGLVDLLARSRATAAAPVLSAQRVLAETAMITAELPSTGTARTIVAMPPRRWDPPQEFLNQLDDLAPAAWAAPVSLRELAAAEPPEVDRGRLHYPRAERRAELPVDYLRALDAQHGRIDNFAGVLTDPDQLVPGTSTPLIPGMESSLRRLESSWWRGREDPRRIRLDRDKDYLKIQRGSVAVQPGSFTFGSKSGMIPLTLVNDLPQEVVVVLRLEPLTPRLKLGAVEPQTIGPKQKVQVNVPATAIAGGPVVVVATLHTRDGAPYGQPVQLRVNVTQIGTVALVITVSAAVVLFLAAGVRVVRRLRAARRTGPPGPDEPAPADETTEVRA